MKHNQRLKRKQQEVKLQAANNEANGTSTTTRKSQRKAALTKTTAEEERDDSKQNNNQQEEGSLRDQGFTRPRLLILVPFRSSAKKIVKTLMNILGDQTSVAGLDRLEEEFADPDPDSDNDDDVNGGGRLSAKQKERRKRSGGPTDKPWDWQQTFQGNVDDDFKIGIQVNPGHGKGSGPAKGCYLRLFSDFYISDIIIASPLGLKLVIDKTVEEDDGSSNKKQKKSRGSGGPTADFLSSIEQVIIHQADVLYMQNWEHVDYILSLTNQIPSEARPETDYSRLRNYFLEKQGSRHRQILLSSFFAHPELLSFFRRYGQSLSGNIRVRKQWESEEMLGRVAVQAKQVFQLLSVPTAGLAAYEEQKFRFFIDNVLTPLLKKKQKHTMIVTPSYLDYVRIRNYLIQAEASCVYVCEYSRESEISRGRSWFYHGVKDLMLYSGRMHFFRRFRMRGVKSIVFYSLPEYPHFYPELVNSMSVAKSQDEVEDVEGLLTNNSDDMLSSLVLTSKLEKLALERVIGEKRCDHMLSSAKSTFVFF
eukprot:scaffold1110_cov182-Ochromonas_danica.AAC.4